MKFLAVLVPFFFVSVMLENTAFAQVSQRAAVLYKDMKQAETAAAKMAVPHHGAYTFGGNEVRMYVYSEVAIVHTVQVRYKGKLSTFAIKTEEDKTEIGYMIDQGADVNALVTRLIQPVEIDGVFFNLAATFPVIAPSTTLDWMAAKFSAVGPGLPGLRVKNNRTINISTDPVTGALVAGQIYQVSIGTLLQPEVLPLDLP